VLAFGGCKRASTSDDDHTDYHDDYYYNEYDGDDYNFHVDLHRDHYTLYNRGHYSDYHREYDGDDYNGSYREAQRARC